MNKLNISMLVLCLFTVLSTVTGQTKKAFIKEAEKAFAAQNYHGALVYYEEALKFDPRDPDIVFKTAEAARNYNAYGYALTKYQYLRDTIGHDIHPESGFRLAEMYHRLGRYDEAISNYQAYISEYSNPNNRFTQLARKNISACKKAKELSSVSDPNIVVTRMGDDVNSPDADFAASDRKGNMYFSSLRFDADAKKLRNKQIARTLIRKGANPAEVLLWTINNKDLSVANFAFANNGSKVFYSVCEYVSGWSQSCKIYSSDVDKDGNFTNEVLLNDNINIAGANNTQPYPGKDLISGMEVLYFVSDRKGGKGGKDIWYSPIDGNSFGPAVNLASVNTEGDEITPFYNTANNNLYFSTDGREGFGGLDIFMTDGIMKVPSLLPAPFNTSMNDMYFFMDETGGHGYLTSNRAGSSYQYESYEACCMDIYSVDINVEPILEVETFVQGENIPLNGTTVCLIDDETGREISCLTNGENENSEKFKLIPNRKYRLEARKDGYTVATDKFVASSGNMNRKLYLAPATLRLEALTFEQPTNLDLIGTTVTLRDLTDGTVKVITITNDRDNDFGFDLIPGHKYKLEASKPGYSTVTADVITAGKTGVIRQDLFLPKVVLQELLPISLYFDNDYPDPRSKLPTTSSRYIALADNYMARKQEYIDRFTAPLGPQEKTAARSEIESFFVGDVLDGKVRFERFLSQLIYRLESGEKMELEVRGFASPRSKSDYNKTLSERRINSINNEMKQWAGGQLSKYIANGSLKLKDVSFGDSTAKPNVVKDLTDERNSIYNINAARERRVEIIKVNYK